MNDRKQIFVFPGQGSQSLGMGREIYDNFLSARAVFNEVDDALGENLTQIIFGQDEARLTATQNAQPALMCVSLAILKVLEQESGQKLISMADFVAGHSLGEYTALASAGSFSIAEAAKILRIRGEAMQSAVPAGMGAMAAILGVEIDLVRAIIKRASESDVLEIANDNSVGQVVISGTVDAIERAISVAKEMGAKRAIKLAVSSAFHSRLIKPAESIMEQALGKMSIAAPLIPLIANVTAELVQDPLEIKNLLVKQVTGMVRWRETMIKAEQLGTTNLVEIGAGKVLSGLVSRSAPTIKAIAVNDIESLKNFLTREM